jgi:solute carrier family 7 (L-type amino acid transporter), member 6
MAERLTETHGFVPLAALASDETDDVLSVSDIASLDGQGHRTVSGSLTRLNGLALVISLQIGSGIFTAPSQVSQFVTTPGYGLLVWLLGGGLVWTGAASFIELGLRIPSNGGIQEYLRTCYGDFMGFLFTWSWVVIAKPAANAIIATIFADYLTHAFVTDEPVESQWILKVVAVLCIATITFVNCLGATAGAKAANMFLILKIGALSSIIGLGGIVWLFGYGDGVPSSETRWFGWTPEQDDIDTWSWIGNYATALFGALFCYGGWETVRSPVTWRFDSEDIDSRQIGFVLGDMANPEGDLPVVINGAMITVIAGFVMMNAALYICLPFEVIRASSTVAVVREVLELGRILLCKWTDLVTLE